MDKSKLMGNMTITQAIGSFLHLCFTFNLEYPKQAQTVADIWQRRIAKYGDGLGKTKIMYNDKTRLNCTYVNLKLDWY